MPHTSSLSPDSLHPGHASDHFDHLCTAQTLRSIVAHHRRLCAALELRPARFPEFYPKLKANLQSWKAQGLLAKFDKRASHKCYNQGYACVDTKVLVIGAGPCGLRAAIEAQLLGAKVLVLEKRDRFSRNNVLHLWPMVIHDLKALGAKKFFGKFCAGAIDHISIRQLQCILLKVALLLGVEFHENVGFEELIEPGDDETGWRARLSPPDHPAADFQFDVLVGADGKRNTFKCFRRKEFRGKLAIAITANFVNRHTEAEARVDEISGVAFIFNQKFFKDLSAATGIDLENIVYYKDDTHYFVMTAKKHSLLAKGVILKDYMDTGQLLAPSNIDRAQLMEFAREAADFSTDFQLPELKFAVNHYGLEDLAMFDFTCMYASCYASTAIVRHGHGLLLQLVGDSLLEPFWPTGSGCARGFLSCFDAAWQMRSWANPRLTALECLAEREATYRLLAQTTPKNLSGDLSGYSLDPRTRYPNLNTQAVMPHQVRHMVDTDSPETLAAELVLAAAAAASAAPPGQAEMPAHKRPFQPIEPTVLLRWCRRCLQSLNIDVMDLEMDFQSGEAICALVHLYRPELLQLSALPELPLDRWRLALRLLQSELPIPVGVTAELLAEAAVEAHQLLELLSRVYDALHAPPPPAAAPRHPWLTEMASEDGDSLQRASPVPRLAADGRTAAANGDTMRRHRKRKSEAAHQRAASWAGMRHQNPWKSQSNHQSKSKSLESACPDDPNQQEDETDEANQREEQADQREDQPGDHPEDQLGDQPEDQQEDQPEDQQDQPIDQQDHPEDQQDLREDQREDQPEDQRDSESTSGSYSLSWDALPPVVPLPPPPVPPAPIDRRKAALVQAAFRGMNSVESFESFESFESESGVTSPGVTSPGGYEDGEESRLNFRSLRDRLAALERTADDDESKLDCRSLRDRLADLERALANCGEQDKERSRIVHWESRKLRSLAERKADLEATLLNGADGQSAGEFDDFTVHLYRKTAADFASRRSRIEDMVFKPSRMTPEVKKAPKQAEPELSKKEQFASKVKDLEAKFSGTYQPPDKKPKPVSRVIGRIEKDWSLQQIEKKIEENSRPFVNRDKEYPVPRWNRDAFDDKFQTIQSLSGGDVIPFRRFDYGQRGSSHVSAMAARFGNGHRPSGTGSASAQGAGGVAAYEPCHFCGQRVFLVDRMVAQQKFFHPKCFRCEYCSVALKPGNYEYDGDAGRFFCLPHFGLHSLVKNKYQRSETTSTVPPCPSPVIEQMRASHLSLRGATPERAEFENSVCDPMSEDELLSEMDEDEWTDRNFLTTEEVLSGGDCSDSDSCSPDSDQFEPALDDDEVLQLAEQWRRLHDPPAQEAARVETEPDSDRHESDGAGRAGDVSDTGQHSETEEETSARLRRRAEDGLTERVLQSRRVRKRTDVRDSQSSGSERASHRPAGDSSSAESDTEVGLRAPPPTLPTSPTSPPPRIVIQVADRPEVSDPGQRPEPIGAERDSSGSGSGSGSGERPPSQERVTASGKGVAKGNAEGKSPRKEIGKKIVGSIPVLKKPVASLMGRNAGKPAAAKTVTTARVSISTLVQQKPVRPTSVSSEDSPTKPNRNIRRNSAQRSRPPTSDSASWRNSTELKRQSLVGPPPSAPAAPAPARSRSAADLGSRISAATGRGGSGQQMARGAATESSRKSVVTRQASADTTRSPPSKIPTRPQPSPRTSVTNGTQRPVAARRNSPPERKTSAPAKLMTEKTETVQMEEKTEIGNVGNAEAGNKGKTETGKLGKSAPIRRGSGGNRVAAIAARDRVRRQVRENMLKQRLARKAREEANKANGKSTGAQRRRSRGDEGRVGAGRSDDAVDQAAGKEKDRRLSMEEEDSGERHRRRGSDGREDGDATSGSSGERNINSPPRARRKNEDKLLSSPDKSSNTDADSASEAISGCETSVEVRLPGPDRDVRMHSSSEDERSNSEQEAVENDGSDEYASPANSDTDVRSTAKTRNFRDSRHSQENIPRTRGSGERRLHAEDETDDMHLSLSGAEEFDDVALEERWKQMLGDDDELMEAGDLDDMLKPKLNSPTKEAALKPVRVTEIDKLWDDVESENEEPPPSSYHVAPHERSAEEGDTYVEFDALLNDVDVTNLERGFDDICDETASTEDLSQEEDSSHGKITSSKVPHSDEKLSDDEDGYADLTRRDTAAADIEHYSSHHDDTASDASHADSYTHPNEPLYDRPSADRDLHSPESPEHAEDTAWVTADSATLDDRVISESDDDEETAWRTAETTALDRSVTSPRDGRVIAPEDCALPDDEDSMYEEEVGEEPPRKPTSVLQEDDASSSDLDDRIQKRSRAQEHEDISDHNTSKSSRRFNLDESFITFRRRRPTTSPHRDTSTRSRSSSPDVIEIHEEASSKRESPAASPPSTVDSLQRSPEPGRLRRNVKTESDLGIEASMEYNQHWVDEWRDVDETTGTWMSEARREQVRQRQRVEDLSIEMEPAVDELEVMETREVGNDEEDARPTPSEAVIDVDEDASTAMSTDAAVENDTNGSTAAVDVRPKKKPVTREVVEIKDTSSADADKYVVIVDEKFNRNSAIQEPMEMPKSTLNGSQATPLKSSSEQRSPSPDILPHLKLFGGDETIDIVCERKRSAEKRGAPQRASLRERIKAIETAPAPAVSKPSEVNTSTEPTPDSRVESRLAALRDAKKPAATAARGPAATSTPMGTARAPLTTLPTPISETEQTPDQSVPSAVFRLIHQTPDSEPAGPVWDWETPCRPRAPPSAPPPPIPETDSGPVSLEPAFLEPTPTPPAWASVPQSRGAVHPLPALSAPAAVLAATAAAAVATSASPPAPVTSPVVASVAPPVAPVTERVSFSVSSPSSAKVSAASTMSTEKAPASATSRVSSTSASPAAVSFPATSATPKTSAVSPTSPLRPDFVSAAERRTPRPPVRVNSLVNKIWPPVSAAESATTSVWSASSAAADGNASRAGASAEPRSPTESVSPTSPTTVASCVPPTKPAKPILPALPLSPVADATKTPTRASPKITTITFPWFETTTPVSPTSPTVPSTPPTPATPTISAPPTTPTTPSGPPFRATRIRVSPLVEEASARLLRRGATDPSLVIPPRSALSGAPMRLSRLPEDLPTETQESREQEEPQQERPPEESLIRDLVLSRVRRSPEKQFRKRVTSPALLGSSGPSVRPLPPPVPGEEVGGEADVETAEVIPPPPLTATRRLPPPPPPPPVEEADRTSEETEEGKGDGQTDRVSGIVKSVIDFSPVAGLVDRPPSPAVTNEPKPTPKTANEPTSHERADQASPPPEKPDQPPPLPDKTRGAARLSLIPAAARALFSPPRRPPRASDQRTPRRKKQGSAERKAVMSMPPEVVGALVAEERDRRPLSESLESPDVSRELESPARGVSMGAETPSAQKKTTTPTEFPTLAASPTQRTSSSAPALDATSREATPSAASVVRPDRRLSPELRTPLPEGKLPPSQSPQVTPPPRPSGAPIGVSSSKDKSSEPVDASKPAEPVTPARGQKESTPGTGEGQITVSPAGAGLTEPATPTTRKKEPSDLKKKRERRRSIIQTISELFRHSTDKKEKDKDKEDKVDASPSSKRESAAPATPPSAADSPTTPSPAAVAAGAAKATPLRNRLGLRFRKSKDKDKKLSISPSLSPPGTPAAADVTDGRPAADLSKRPSLGSEPRPTPSGRSSPEGTLSRRSRSGRAARHSEIRRQQRAQELQRQLGEVEVRQQELQICAAELERTIRGEPREDGVQQLTDDAALMRDWFGLVHERSLLVRRDQLLQLQLQQLQLEDRHDRLQLELRERMASPEAQKSSEDIDRERELVNTLLELSEQRRALKLAMDAEQDALRAECESAEERQQLLAAPRVPLEESTV